MSQVTNYLCLKNVYLSTNNLPPNDKIVGYFSVIIDSSGPCLTWTPYHMLPNYQGPLSST